MCLIELGKMLHPKLWITVEPSCQASPCIRAAQLVLRTDVRLAASMPIFRVKTLGPVLSPTDTALACLIGRFRLAHHGTECHLAGPSAKRALDDDDGDDGDDGDESDNLPASPSCTRYILPVIGCNISLMVGVGRHRRNVPCAAAKVTVPLGRQLLFDAASPLPLVQCLSRRPWLSRLETSVPGSRATSSGQRVPSTEAANRRVRPGCRARVSSCLSLPCAEL